MPRLRRGVFGIPRSTVSFYASSLRVGPLSCSRNFTVNSSAKHLFGVVPKPGLRDTMRGTSYRPPGAKESVQHRCSPEPQCTHSAPPARRPGLQPALSEGLSRSTSGRCFREAPPVSSGTCVRYALSGHGCESEGGAMFLVCRASGRVAILVLSRLRLGRFAILR